MYITPTMGTPYRRTPYSGISHSSRRTGRSFHQKPSPPHWNSFVSSTRTRQPAVSNIRHDGQEVSPSCNTPSVLELLRFQHAHGRCSPAVSEMSYPYQTLARQDMWRDASRIRKPNQSTRNERAREGRVRTTTWMNRSLERLRLARQRHAACHRCPRMVRPVRLGQAPCPPRSCCCTRARRCRRAWQTAACATTRSGVAEPATCPHHQASGTQISAHKVGVCAIENHV